MSYLLKYSNWSRLFTSRINEAAFEFDPAAKYSDKTFNIPNASSGGTGGDWGGTLQRALAFAKVANDFVGKNIVISQKRNIVKTASGNTSDHYSGNENAYGIDLSCKGDSGDALLAHLMSWFGHPEYTGGKWFTVNKDGYRYQVGWKVPNHYDHIHVGVKKSTGASNTEVVPDEPEAADTQTVPTTLNSDFDTLTDAEKREVSDILGIPLDELILFFKNNKNIDMSDIQSGKTLLKLGSTGETVREAQLKLKQKGYLSMDPTGTYDTATKAAVENFQKSNGLSRDGIIGPLTYPILFSDSAVAAQTPTATTPLPVVTTPVANSSNIQGGTWQEVAANYIAKKEGFSPKAGWDQNAYRGGYGSDKVLKNGVLTSVTKDTTFTEKEALDTLREYSIKKYSDQVIKDLGVANWNKLNNNQKAALISLSYNAGAYFISARSYGKKIKTYIENNDLVSAGKTIYTDGPKSGAQSGYIPSLEKRRREESDMFLA